jgi:tellurite methyltransferase
LSGNGNCGGPARDGPTREPRDQWDRVYGAAEVSEPPAPARVLAENAHLLPASGRALDLASGLGGNALLLAAKGLEAQAFDISTEALVRLDAWAARLGLSVKTEVRDVVAEPPAPDSFDVIVVSRFLDRSLTGAIKAALRPGGLLFYQTFTREKTTPGGPSNPDYLLAPGELLDLFRGLRLVVYREEGLLGNPAQGFRNQALLVAQNVRSSL